MDETTMKRNEKRFSDQTTLLVSFIIAPRSIFYIHFYNYRLPSCTLGDILKSSPGDQFAEYTKLPPIDSERTL